MKAHMRNGLLRPGLQILIAGFLIYLSCQGKDINEEAARNILLSKSIWATGYLAGCRHTDQSISFLTREDYQFLTHIVHYGGMLKSDGSIDLDYLNMDQARRKIAIDSAHAAGKPILLCAIGEYNIFQQAIENHRTRSILISQLISFMEQNGYDGIDLNMAPVCAPSGSFGYNGVDLVKNTGLKTEFPVNHAYISLVKALRTALDSKNTPLLDCPLLTAAITWRDRFIFGRKDVHAQFDQINLMAYDMSSPIDSDVTWFDSPIFNGGFKLKKYNKPAYSIEMFVDDCLDAGIPAKKLGIGIRLDALVWQGGEGVAETEGVTAPRQSWRKPPTHPHYGAPRYTYAQMMEMFYSPEVYHWDEVAQASYLSIDQPGSSGDMFISYNDERSITAKIDYLKKRGLGGFTIWDLYSDFRPDQPEGQKRPLRKAMQEALNHQ